MQFPARDCPICRWSPSPRTPCPVRRRTLTFGSMPCQIMPDTPESMAVMIEDAISGNLNEVCFLPPSGGFYFLWYPQSQYGPPDANVYCRMNSLPPPTSPSAILHISSCFPPVFNPKSQKSCLCQTACFSASNYNRLGREMQPVSGSLCFADGRQWAEKPENAVSLARKPHLCYTVVSQEKLRRMLAGGTLCL